MNTKIFTVFAILITFSINCIGQGLLNKNFDFQHGDVTINKSSIKIEGDSTYRVFEITAPVEGDYYLSAFILVANKDDGTMSYRVQLNDNEVKESIIPATDGWQNITLKKPLKLLMGINTISIVSSAPEIVEVESIILAKDKNKATISTKAYTEYMRVLEAQKLSANYAATKKAAIEAEKNNSHLRSVKLTNPEGNYDHEMELDFKYTYYTTLYLSAGQTLTLETKNATTDPVLHLFNANDPINQGAWSDDDGAGVSYNSKITATIQYSGIYFVLIRKYLNPSSVAGTCDLYKNGSLFVTKAAVSGSAIACDKNVTEELNYFTKLTSGDSRIWIEAPGNPGPIVAFNDDYTTTGPHDFDWGSASRVKQNFNKNISTAIVSAYSASIPTGKCDLYMNCKNSDVCGWDSLGSFFPVFKADDAIQSAPFDTIYNCISWSGGITDYWEWPSLVFSKYYSENPLTAFDNFYAATRYAGAMTYSRTGATVSNSVIDLWAYKGYSHASVRKPGNNMPHGYDWESKPGMCMRTFHPRYALAGTGYGIPKDYYIPTSSNPVMLLDESIARGYSVIENVELTPTEKNRVAELINSLTNSQREEFENKYIAWKKTWKTTGLSFQSDPRAYALNNEYKVLIEYSKSQGESIWPLVFEKLQLDGFLVLNLLEDLTLPEKQSVLNKIKEKINNNISTESGAIIVRSPEAIAMLYIKELINQSDGGLTDNDGIRYSNTFKFNVFPNPVNASSQLSFVLPAGSMVSAYLIGLDGKLLSVVIKEQSLIAGNQNFNLNVPVNFKGSCLLKLVVNNVVNVQLISVL
jgi:hypothetical protein